jgi:hypothetical protein
MSQIRAVDHERRGRMVGRDAAPEVGDDASGVGDDQPLSGT